MTAPATKPARPDMAGLLAQVDSARNQIAAYLPPAVHVEQFFALARRAILEQPELAECSANSVLRALGACAASGLALDGKFSSLIVRKAKQGKPTATWDPTFRGMTTLALSSGHITDVQSAVVRAGDVFEYELGSEPKLTHKPNIAGGGEVIAAYAIATLRAGGKVIEVLTRPDLEKIRALSPAGDKGPWGGWADEMSKKSAIRRLLKRLPAGPARLLDFPEWPAAARIGVVSTSPGSVAPSLPPLLPEQENVLECAALERLSNADTLEDLDVAWTQCRVDFGQAGAEVPLKVEARFHARREAIEAEG